MVECFRCSEWFHPHCLNLSHLNEIQLSQIEIYCLPCKKEFEKNFGEIINEIPSLKPQAHVFKY